MGDVLKLVPSKAKPKKRVINPDSESFRQSLIIKFLKTIPRSRVIRLYNCPPFDSKNNRFIRGSSSLTPNGLPDLLFISELYGVHFLEVKSEIAYNALMRKIDKIRTALTVSKSNQHLRNQILLTDELNSYKNVKASFVSTVDHVKQAIGYLCD